MSVSTPPSRQHFRPKHDPICLTPPKPLLQWACTLQTNWRFRFRVSKIQKPFFYKNPILTLGHTQCLYKKRSRLPWMPVKTQLIYLPALNCSNFEQRKDTHFIGFVHVYGNFLTDHLNYLHNMHVMKRKREVDGENYNYMLLRHEMTSI